MLHIPGNKRKSKLKENVDLILLITFLILFFAGAIWGSVATFIAGWNTRLSYREEFILWLKPMCLIIPSLILLVIFNIRTKN